MSSNIEKVLLDKDLIKMLVCPITKSNLIYDKVNNELISKKAGLVFPIINGVPILILDEARNLKKDLS
ncbi:Trm112 family protein [Alphaproteobacteria bacterium]|nr:Trm112 family protein [Alphaproteobacteria bacterium]